MNIPGFTLYGGATITRVVDGAGSAYIGACAKRLSDSTFGFWVFRDGSPLPLTPFCTGRGSISDAGTWVAWEKDQYHTGSIPGFVPIVTAGVPGLPSVEGGTLRIGAQNPPLEGGEIQLAAGDGGPPFVIDVYGDYVRIHHNGTVIVQWKKG